MNEVSCRAFRYFQVAAADGACDLDALVAGTGVARSVFEDPTARVSWDVWAQICNRFGEAYSSDAALQATGRYALNDVFTQMLGRVSGLFVDARVLYQLAARWGAQNVYHSIEFGLDDRDPGRMIVSARLLPGFAPSRACFVMLGGGFEILPCFLGGPAARLEWLQLDGHGARFAIHPAVSSRRSRLGQVWAALRAPEAIADELVAQQAELSRAWVEMRRTTQSFRNALDAMPHLVAVHTKGKVRYVNPAFQQLVGRTLQSLLGSSFVDLVAEEDRSAASHLVGEDRSSRPLTMRLRVAGGGLAWVEGRSAGATEFEGEESSLLLCTDLRGERDVREELARTEATISALLEHLPDLVLRLSGDMVLLDVQGGRGLEERDALGMLVGTAIPALLDAFSYADSAPVREEMERYRRSIAEGRVFEWESTLPGPSGRLRAFRVRGVPLLGGKESLLFVHEDTERKETEQRLRVAERMASLGTLAAGIAHEINNPLTYVTVNLELLREALAAPDVATGATLGKLVDDAVDGAARIRATLDRMRELSRIEPPRVELIDPQHLLERAIAMTGHALRHRARLVTDVRPTRGVLGDPTGLVEVFINLIANAAQALPENAGRDHEVRLTLADDGDWVCATFQDTGAGIAPELVGRIFEPFFTTKASAGGTGLGLAIAHRVVTGLGGKIDVASIPAVGTTFVVRLPAAPDDAPRSSPPTLRPSSTGPSRRARVLVIDDDPAVARGLSRALSIHHVTVMNDGAQALEHLGTHPPPDVVLCDLMMPDLSGVDVYEWIQRELPELVERIVFLTGGAFTERAEEFVARPGLRVVRKPVAIDDLRRIVDEVVKATAERETAVRE